MVVRAHENKHLLSVQFAYREQRQEATIEITRRDYSIAAYARH